VALATVVVLWFAAATEQGKTGNPLIRALAWAGAISYPLYLIHFSVLFPFMNLLERFVLPSELLYCAVWFAAVVLSTIAAWGIHCWVEVPAEHLRKTRWAAKPRIV
jgi:peptidoglycan/LPS O-acetylase OafA/YrhL